MRIYETVFIIKPDVGDEDVDKFVTQMESVVTSGGGKVQKTDKWGRRRLAYEVKGQREGQFVVCTMECDPPVSREFERLLKVAEPVIKFQTVRIDEELKRLEKMRLKREKRGGGRSARGPHGGGPTHGPTSPGPTSPPTSPGPTSPPTSPGPTSPPTSSGPTSPGPTSPGPTSPGPTSPGPASPGPAAQGPAPEVAAG